MTSGKLDQLGAATNTPAHTKELAHLTKKVQKLVLMLHPYPKRQTCGWNPTHSNATIYRYPVCYTMANEPNNIPPTGYHYIW